MPISGGGGIITIAGSPGLVLSGLTHHWPMDDANGGNNPVDVIAGLNGTASGAGLLSAVGPTGVPGTARQFDGTHYIDLGVNAVIPNFAADWTLCLWGFVPTIGTAGLGPFFCNFLNSGATDAIDCMYRDDVPNIGTIEFGEFSGADINASGSRAIADGVWTFMCVAHPNGAVSAGNSYFQGTVWGDGGTGNAPDHTVHSNIGTRGPGSRNLQNGDRVGRILVYNRVLTPAEIWQNYLADNGTLGVATLSFMRTSHSITLSNGNLTATCTATGSKTANGVRVAWTGKKYFEAHLDAFGANHVYAGVGTVGTYPEAFVGSTINGISLRDDANIIQNGGNVGTGTSFAAGDTVGVALDIDANKVWFRVNGGNWNNDVIGNQNPVTGVGGISTSSIVLPFTTSVTCDLAGTAWTVNYSTSPPSGFSNW